MTTSNPDAALNFSMADQVEHEEHYRLARKSYDVVTALRDSLADDAFTRDVDSGCFFDPDRVHTFEHKGQKKAQAKVR